MKAVFLKAFGGTENFAIDKLNIKQPSAGELQIQIKAASFNPIDIWFREGRLGGKLPLVLGRDLSGVVTCIGDKVDNFAVGDQVYGYLPGLKSNGSYAEIVTAPLEFFARKPANLNFAQASGVPVVGLTAFKCVVLKAQVLPDQTVFVAGAAGGVGTYAVQLLNNIGVSSVIATAGSEQSADYLTKNLGIPFEKIIFYRDLSLTELKRRVVELNGGAPVDVAFDFVGGQMKRLCFEIVEVDGKVVSIVEEPPDFDLNLWDENTSPMILKGVSFIFEQLGALVQAGKGKESWKSYGEWLGILADLFERKILKPMPTTSLGSLSVQTVQEAHKLLETGKRSGEKLIMEIS